MDAAVALVESYLRLNGFLTATEYQVQQPAAGEPGRFHTATDLDLLAIRLPWTATTVLRHPQRGGEDRCEILLAEDPALDLSKEVPDVLIGEVKEGAGQLNRRLQTPDVLHAALRRVGCCPEAHLAEAAATLQREGEYRTGPAHGLGCRIRLAAFCGHLEDGVPVAPLTITLDHVLRFIQQRLVEYRPILRSAQFGDPILNLVKLVDKLGLQVVAVAAQTNTDGR